MDCDYTIMKEYYQIQVSSDGKCWGIHDQYDEIYDLAHAKECLARCRTNPFSYKAKLVMVIEMRGEIDMEADINGE